MSSFLFEEFPTLRVLVGRRDHVLLREWKMPDEDPASLPESHGRACGFADLDPEGSGIEAGLLGLVWVEDRVRSGRLTHRG